MTVINAWVGAATQTSARVVAKIDGAAARLLVADNPEMSGALATDVVTASDDGVVSLPVGGLQPDARYWWHVEVDSTPDTETTGRIRTLPPVGERADFTFSVGHCAAGATSPGEGDVLAADRLSNHPVFAQIINRDPLFNVHLGDLHYYDLGSDNHGITGGASLANYRRAYDDVLLQSNQHLLYRHVPLVLNWDDHDRGPNDNDRTFAGAVAAQQAYRERVPHHLLPDADGIYHSFEAGRVLFIVDDVRTFRDPNSAPNNPGKTMLGTGQKLWMQQLLSSTQAEFLVWLSAERAWHVPDVASPSGSTDSWGAFTHERAELIEMFGDLGWLDRMLIINGDFHHMGINSGAHPYGGMPVFQFGTYDSSSADPDGPPPSPQLWDVGSLPGSGRYGTVRITDTGRQITITGIGWLGDTPQLTHTFTVDVAAPPTPPPTPSPAPVARAKIRRAVTWYGCHAVTGRIIAELPDVRGEIGRLLSAYDSAQLTIPIPLGGPGHVPIKLIEQATQPVNSAIVAVVNDLPVWMGWVLSRRGGTGAELRLATATPEAYLTRRRVRDHTMMGMDRARVAAVLAGDANGIDGVGPGFGFEIDAQLSGDIIDRVYLASDRITVYDALRELSIQNLEFTVDLDWQSTDRNVVRKILRLYPRIGKAEGGALFESRAGSEATYDLLEDATTGRMANHIIAIGPGEGDDQPASTPAVDQAALDAGAPIVEAILDLSSATAQPPGALDAAARAELARLRRGAEVWEISARLAAYPRLGVDVQLGDTVSWLLTGHRHPTGVMGTGRMVGYRVDQQAGRWRPILLDPQEAP